MVAADTLEVKLMRFRRRRRVRLRRGRFRRIFARRMRRGRRRGGALRIGYRM